MKKQQESKFTQKRNTKARSFGTNKSGKTSQKRSAGFTPSRMGDGSSPDNPLLKSMSVETPIGTTKSLLFPTDSASMQNRGNYITTPGQDNFIDEWCRITQYDGVPSAASPEIHIKAGGHAKTSANIMIIPFTHYFGSIGSRVTSTTITSPVGMAGLNLKQFIDTSFGTNTSYDPQDLMLYLMGISAVFPIIAEVKRNMRLLVTAREDSYPQFTPLGVLYGLEVIQNVNDYNNEAKYLSNHIDELNQIIVAFNRLPIPPELMIFGYNDDLFSALWTDSEDLKTAQLYAFENETAWYYNEEGYDFPTLIPYAISDHSTAHLIDVLRDMVTRLSALRTSSTAMLQNLYNAYGSKNTIHIATLPHDLDPLPFFHDKGICTMIENCVPIPRGVCEITQIAADPNRQDIVGSFSLLSNSFSEFKANDYIKYAVNVPLQFHVPVDDVTPEDIGWAMRMRAMFLDQSLTNVPTAGTFYRLNCDQYVGFAVPRDVRVIQVIESVTGITYSKANLYRQQDDVAPGSDTHIYWPNICRDFKYAPIQVYGQWTTGTPEVIAEYIVMQYTANRDVEVTYRQEDIRMFWTYMSMNIWGSAIERNAIGTRSRGIDKP